MTPFGEPASFRLEVEVIPPVALDSESMGPVRLVQVTGGRVFGSLTGRILPGGADWQTLLPDGTIEIEARYLLELEDGARIELQNRGRRAGPTGPFWSTIWLRCEAPQYRHLNGEQFLALGTRREGFLEIAAFALPAI